MNKFFESSYCINGDYCQICRRKDAVGNHWRTNLSKRFEMPQDSPNFICEPRKLDWSDESFQKPTIQEQIKVFITPQWFTLWWREFHTEKNPSEAKLQSMRDKIHCRMCLDELDKLISQNPMRLNDYFKWAWEIHEGVNEKLNKKGITLDEARILYGHDNHLGST